MPINVYYCKKCKIPPEYCGFLSNDIASCKADLASQNEELYQKLYPEVNEGDEEKVEEGKVKKKKKVGFGKAQEAPGQIKVIKTKFKGKKKISIVVGL